METGTNLRGGYFTMKTAYIYPFPIKSIDFSNKEEKAKYEKIITLVDQMLDLKERIKRAKADAEKLILQRQIELIDNQIDQLVYDLYRFTKDEIKLIEDSMNKK